MGVEDTTQSRAEARSRVDSANLAVSRLNREIASRKDERTRALRREASAAHKLHRIQDIKQRTVRTVLEERRADAQIRKRKQTIGRLKGIAGGMPAGALQTRLQAAIARQKQLLARERGTRRAARLRLRALETTGKQLGTEREAKSDLEKKQDRRARVEEKLSDSIDRLDKTERERNRLQGALQRVGKVSWEEVGTYLSGTAKGLGKIADSLYHQSATKAGASLVEGTFGVTGNILSLIPEIGPVLGGLTKVLGKLNPVSLVASLEEGIDQGLKRNFQYAQYSPHMRVIQTLTQVAEMHEEIARGQLLAPSALRLAATRARYRQSSRLAQVGFMELLNNVQANMVEGVASLHERDERVRRREGKTTEEIQRSLRWNFGIPSPGSFFSRLRWYDFINPFGGGPIGAPLMRGDTRTDEEKERDNEELNRLRASDPAWIESNTVGPDSFAQIRGEGGELTMGEQMVRAGLAGEARARGERVFNYDSGPFLRTSDWAADYSRPQRF